MFEILRRVVNDDVAYPRVKVLGGQYRVRAVGAAKSQSKECNENKVIELEVQRRSPNLRIVLGPHLWGRFCHAKARQQ